MPKYYVTNGIDQMVIDHESARESAREFQSRFGVFVSEIGFGNPTDRIIFIPEMLSLREWQEREQERERNILNRKGKGDMA